MTMRRSVSVAVGVGAALLLVVSGCSDRSGPAAGESTGGTADRPATTTIDLTLNGKPVDLGGATSKCYDYQGHLMVEAFNAEDTDASHFLADYHRDKLTLSIGVRGGQPDLFEYEEGKQGQSAEVTRNGDSVSVKGTIGVALDDTTPPQPFTITAHCAKFFDTPPDSSKIGSDEPSIPSTCPAGEAVCLPGGN